MLPSRRFPAETLAIGCARGRAGTQWLEHSRSQFGRPSGKYLILDFLFIVKRTVGHVVSFSVFALQIRAFRQYLPARADSAPSRSLVYCSGRRFVQGRPGVRRRPGGATRSRRRHAKLAAVVWRASEPPIATSGSSDDERRRRPLSTAKAVDRLGLSAHRPLQCGSCAPAGQRQVVSCDHRRPVGA